jgi:hypothetical protein
MISNNIIQDCATVGIDVSFGAGASVSGVGASGPDESEGIMVIGNNCSNNLGGGISTGSNGTLIANNVCKDNGSASKPNAAGITVVQARNVIIKGNITGNSANVTLQKYGLIFRTANMQDPIKATVVDNDLRGNAVASVIADNGGNPPVAVPLSTGHVFAHNRGLDDGVRKYSADYTVTSADQGAVFSNTGATGAVTFTLPDAEEGLIYTFAVYPSKSVTVRVPANTDDTIWIGNSTPGTSISNATNGSVITLRAVSTSRWYAVTHEGTWSLN